MTRTRFSAPTPGTISAVGHGEHEVAGQLSDPLPRRVPCNSDDVDPARADLEEEEHVDPPQQHRVDSEQVTRQHRRRLGTAALPPRPAGAPRSGVKPSVAQNVPDCRRSDSKAKPDEFAVDPSVTPHRILPSEPDHQVTDDGRNAHTTSGWFRLRRVGPAPWDQLPVPTKQRLRRHNPHPQHLARQHSGQARPARSGPSAPAEDGSPADATPKPHAAAPAVRRPTPPRHGRGSR